MKKMKKVVFFIFKMVKKNVDPVTYKLLQPIS